MQAKVQPRLAVVVPTLNEAANIGPVLERIRRALDSVLSDYEVIVVDDSSQDGTIHAAEEAAAGDHRIRTCVRGGERGLAGAIQHGWKQTDAEFLAVIDADLQHPPEILPRMFESALRGHDVVVASRYAPGGSSECWSKFRLATSRMAVWVAFPLQRRALRVSDPMSGFFLVRRECVRDCTFRMSGFKLLLEVLIRGNLRTSSEIPYSFELRGGGKSKLTFAVALSYFSLLLELYRTRLFEPSSPQLSAGLGILRSDLKPVPSVDLSPDSSWPEEASL